MSDHAPSATSVVATYFQPPQGYFWRWAEGNAVVEWLSGTTITYREELAALLASLAPEGLPPLGAVLLLLAACNGAWAHNSGEIGLLQGLLRGLPKGGPPDEELTFHLSVARSFLDVVHALPAELRQGTAKEHLLRQVFGGNNTPRRLPVAQSRRLATDLAAYAETEPMLPEGQATRQQLRADLLCFDRAARLFPTVHGLELRLRTGLDQLPAPLPDPPAPPPSPEPPADLLAELATDTQTAGLARLVPHLRAALHLPQPARQAGDQPLGGVADLANRGPLDRLLLSELAQDDLSLLARLAHGEALYLRREAPPLPQPLPRVLLLDTTLHMWGVPRVVGLAAALALAPAAGPSQPPTLAFALGRQAAQPLDLRTRLGVVAALGHLDPALHCGAALLALLPTLPATAEAVLITEAQAARQPEFLTFLQATPASLRFLLTVARSGELVLYELAAGRRTVLSTSRVEVEAVLFAPAPRSVTSNSSKEQTLPAFVGEQPAPLFFPTLNIVTLATTMLLDEKLGVVGVDNNSRLLYWPTRQTGALELVPQVEASHYHFGFGPRSPKVHLLISFSKKNRRPSLFFYTVDLVNFQVERLDLSAQLAPFGSWADIQYERLSETFTLRTPTGWLLFNCVTRELIPREAYFLPPSTPPSLPSPGYLNPGYSALQRVGRVGLGYNGSLLIENYQLRVDAENNLLLEKSTGFSGTHAVRSLGGSFKLTANPQIRGQRLVWPNGSEAIADRRGLLHLRSTNTTLAEITLVLAIGQPTAAWASDGYTCGNYYFTGREPGDRLSLPANDFYATYIQPFLDHLR